MGEGVGRRSSGGLRRGVSKVGDLRSCVRQLCPAVEGRNDKARWVTANAHTQQPAGHSEYPNQRSSVLASQDTRASTVPAWPKARLSQGQGRRDCRRNGGLSELSVHTALYALLQGLHASPPSHFCSAPSFTSCGKRKSREQPGRRQGRGALGKPPVLNPTGVSRAMGAGQDQDHGERGSAGLQPGPHQRSALSRALLSPCHCGESGPQTRVTNGKSLLHFPWVLQRGVSRGLQPASSSVCGWSFL